MAKYLDNQNDSTINNTTPYQGQEKQFSAEGTHLSFVGLISAFAITAIVVAIAVGFWMTPQTDPAPTASISPPLTTQPPVQNVK